MPSAIDPVVVLGFGVAAVNAVMALRDAGYAGRLVVVTDDEPAPYSPVLTSYYAGGRIDREQCFAWSEQGVDALIDDVLPHARIAAVDVAAHEVQLADGERIRYSKLLVATGAHPVAPGFPETGSYRPLMLRTLRDAERLRAALASDACRSVLISGTSMVGLKALEACLDQGVRVTLLGRSPHILRGSAHPLVAQRFEELLEQRGVTLRLSQKVVCADGCEAGGSVDAHAARPSYGCTVVFDDGIPERFDEIILAQGVRPNLDFMPQELLADGGGLAVDCLMRTSAPDVFAAGDVAQALDLVTGDNRIIGLWQNAVQQGRCAGAAIAADLAGHEPARPYPGSISSNVIHVRDILFASAGAQSQEPGRSVEIIESPEEMVVFTRERRAGQDCLVGFSLLSTACAPQQREALADKIGQYRKEVLASFL